MTSLPEYCSHEEYVNRLKKLEEIKALGIDPYPAVFKPEKQSAELAALYPSLEGSEAAEKGETPFTKVAGRLVLFRAMGKNAFGHIQDESGKIQIMFNRDNTLVEGLTPAKEEGDLTPLKFIEKKIDLGDILGVEGHLFLTHKGELTLYAKKVTLLCKTLLPLADKHAGLNDKELRYRKRWLDLISNEDVRKTFAMRSKILFLIREYFEKNGFMEVETPVLQSVYGGAEAKPFTTKLNALNQDMFLRISPEISLKKLIVGGMGRIFEIAKVFRNEGIDRSHNPEFTLLEAYAPYWDYNDMMVLTENLFEKLALTLLGTTKVKVTTDETKEPVEIDLKAPWIRLSMKECIKKYGNIDVDALSDQEMKEILIKGGEKKEEVVKLSRGLLIASLFEMKGEPHLIQPHHIIDHPIETTPLCKLHRDPKERAAGIVERFESFILGGEICNAYTELNDPILQRSLLDDQVKRREAGDQEASPMDEEFLESIHQGMPPTGGLGIGIDRLIILLTGAHSIRDVLFFPWMRPKE